MMPILDRKTYDAMIRAFYEFIKRIRVDLRDMPASRFLQLIDSLPWNEYEKELVDAWKVEALKAAERASFREMKKLGIKDIKTLFTLDNPYSERWAATNSARLVREVFEPTREALRQIAARGFAEHLTVADQACLIRGFIDKRGEEHPGIVGLLNRDHEAVSKYYEVLTTKKGYTHDEAMVAAGRYGKALLMRRGDNIARTETARAQEHGKMATWQIARDDGYISTASKKRWIAAPQERTCDECQMLHNEMVELDEDFSGGVDGPPLHPSCRCNVQIFTLVPGMKGRNVPEKYDERELAELREANAAYLSEQRSARRAWLNAGGRKPRS